MTHDAYSWVPWMDFMALGVTCQERDSNLRRTCRASILWSFGLLE